MPWDEMALKVGQAVGQEDAITETWSTTSRRTIARLRRRQPGVRGQDRRLVTPYEGLFVYGPDDPRARLLGDLGFDFTPRRCSTTPGASSAAR